MHRFAAVCGLCFCAKCVHRMSAAPEGALGAQLRVDHAFTRSVCRKPMAEDLRMRAGSQWRKNGSSPDMDERSRLATGCPQSACKLMSVEGNPKHAHGCDDWPRTHKLTPWCTLTTPVAIMRVVPPDPATIPVAIMRVVHPGSSLNPSRDYAPSVAIMSLDRNLN